MSYESLKRSQTEADNRLKLMALKKRSLFNTQNGMIFIAILYITLALFLKFILDYNFQRADVRMYWQESLNWMMPFNEHPPLYSSIITIFRSFTFNRLPPTIIMMIINLAFLLLSVFIIVQISKNTGSPEWFGVAMAILFCLWPFVGLTYTVIPLADIPAIALTLVGVLMFQTKRIYLGSFFFSLAIITHKGIWPVICFIFLAHIIKQERFLSTKNIISSIILLGPLLLLWIAGSIFHDSLSWFMERSLQVNTTFNKGLIIFKGLVDTFRTGGFTNIIKGFISSALIIFALFFLVVSLIFRTKGFEISAASSLGILIVFLFSSQLTLWGPVRFSRILVLPIIFIAGSQLEKKQITRNYIVLGSLIVILFILTQFVYSWYTARVFYAVS